MLKLWFEKSHDDTMNHGVVTAGALTVMCHVSPKTTVVQAREIADRITHEAWEKYGMDSKPVRVRFRYDGGKSPRYALPDL